MKLERYENEVLTISATPEERQFLLDVIKASWNFDPVARFVDEIDLALLQNTLQRQMKTPMVALKREQFLDINSIFIAATSAERMEKFHGIPDEKVKEFDKKNIKLIFDRIKKVHYNS